MVCITYTSSVDTQNHRHSFAVTDNYEKRIFFLNT